MSGDGGLRWPGPHALSHALVVSPEAKASRGGTTATISARQVTLRISHPSLSLHFLIWEMGTARAWGADCPCRDSCRSCQRSSQQTSARCHSRLSLHLSPGG